MWTKERHEAALARCKAIKDAGWDWPVVSAVDTSRHWNGCSPELDWNDPCEETFAEHARADLPEALAEIEHLQVQLEELHLALDEETRDTIAFAERIVALKAAIRTRDQSRFHHTARVPDGDSGSYPVCPHCGRRENSCPDYCPTRQFPNGEGSI